MKAPTALVAAFALALTFPAKANPLDRWQPLIKEASVRYGIPATWIERVILAESGGHTRLNGQLITSSAGAMGLMQLMPQTWAEITKSERLGSNPHHPRANILAGTYYLRLMYDRFGYPGLFAAYNAGPARYSAYLSGRASLPGETRQYVRSVTAHSRGRRTYSDQNPPAGLVVRSTKSDPRPEPHALFAIKVGGSASPAQ
ncbi:lytic transglycosylase domain-containing protein [Sphingomonas colocasiae]|uniref:Lytic transglycosylase domain-containing protein n=1 Tax=Sphingomonas colocasiae TaxID=1848973 RepID=A0ABS7PIE8_9SPHN|nr:lytic transglycosylase domain-containing protein [Sphingomonas colocasiae]MBY8821056.1 lytic transglycosylase domain-containing protein [Sphingomonas colocasiae]